MRRIWWLAVAAGLVGCAGTETAMPENLRFPAGESAVLRVAAAGAQVYECKASAQDATKLDWMLVAPDAQLYATGGTVMGKHYGGPTWEALDGSAVVGELRARADAPDPDAIPWLLLRAKSTSIQRINTVGGKAPPGCSSAELGHTLRVRYTAVYVFSEAR